MLCPPVNFGLSTFNFSLSPLAFRLVVFPVNCPLSTVHCQLLALNPSSNATPKIYAARIDTNATVSPSGTSNPGSKFRITKNSNPTNAAQNFLDPNNTFHLLISSPLLSLVRAKHSCSSNALPPVLSSKLNSQIPVPRRGINPQSSILNPQTSILKPFRLSTFDFRLSTFD